MDGSKPSRLQIFMQLKETSDWIQYLSLMNSYAPSVYHSFKKSWVFLIRLFLSADFSS